MPNEDFVSRQWLIDEYRRRHQGPPGGALKMIEEAPAADVEPVRPGRWIPGDRFEYDGHGETVRHPGGITCSKCRYSFAEKYLWSRSYCPHCGAKMDAEPPKENPDDK